MRVEFPDVHPLHPGLHILVLRDGPQALVESGESLIDAPPLKHRDQDTEGNHEQGHQPQVQRHPVDKPVVLLRGHQDMHLPVSLHLPGIDLVALPLQPQLRKSPLQLAAPGHLPLIGAVHDLSSGGLHQENAVHVRRAAQVQLVQIPEAGFHIDINLPVLLQRPVFPQQGNAVVLPGSGFG